MFADEVIYSICIHVLSCSPTSFLSDVTSDVSIGIIPTGAISLKEITDFSGLEQC